MSKMHLDANYALAMLKMKYNNIEYSNGKSCPSQMFHLPIYYNRTVSTIKININYFTNNIYTPIQLAHDHSI